MTRVYGYSFLTRPPPSTRPILGSLGLAGVPSMIGPLATASSWSRQRLALVAVGHAEQPRRDQVAAGQALGGAARRHFHLDVDRVGGIDPHRDRHPTSTIESCGLASSRSACSTPALVISSSKILRIVDGGESPPVLSRPVTRPDPLDHHLAVADHVGEVADGLLDLGRPHLLLRLAGSGGRGRAAPRSARPARPGRRGTRATGDHPSHELASLRSGRGGPPDATREPGRVVRDHPGHPLPCETAVRSSIRPGAITRRRAEVSRSAENGQAGFFRQARRIGFRTQRNVK